MPGTPITDVLDLLGDRARVVRQGTAKRLDGPAPVRPGVPGALSFLTGAAADTMASTLAATESALVLVDRRVAVALDDAAGLDGVRAWVVGVDHPRTEYVKLLNACFPPPRPVGVHPSAIVSTEATLGTDVYVGPGAVIERAAVGDRCVIGAGAVLLDNVTLGDDCVVGPNTTIGFTGFGYVRDADGVPVPFPHYAGVWIGDRVEIGANTAIDRGTLSDTVIEDDAKVDNLVHVAHNCRIRRGAFVIAHTILCGGVEVGEGAWVAPNASVREQVRVGAAATVGLAATVLRDVPPGAVVVGSPAHPLTP